MKFRRRAPLFLISAIVLFYGQYVQEQMFSYLSWAVPLLAVGAALAFILVAAS